VELFFNFDRVIAAIHRADGESNRRG